MLEKNNHQYTPGSAGSLFSQKKELVYDFQDLLGPQIKEKISKKDFSLNIRTKDDQISLTSFRSDVKAKNLSDYSPSKLNDLRLADRKVPIAPFSNLFFNSQKSADESCNTLNFDQAYSPNYDVLPKAKLSHPTKSLKTLGLAQHSTARAQHDRRTFKSGPAADKSEKISHEDQKIFPARKEINEHARRVVSFICPDTKNLYPSDDNKSQETLAINLPDNISLKASGRQHHLPVSKRPHEAKLYWDYEELQAQMNEIDEMKYRMERDDPYQSHKDLIEKLLLNQPNSLSDFGDIETFEEVQQIVKRFVYHRSKLDCTPELIENKNLQSRLNKLVEILTIKNERCDELSAKVNEIVLELATVRQLLTEKEHRITVLQSKLNLENIYQKHHDRVFNNSLSANHVVGSHNSSSAVMGSNDELYHDLAALMRANYQLEQENGTMRRRLSRIGYPTDVSTSELDPSTLDFSVLADPAKREAYMQTHLPMVFSLKKRDQFLSKWLELFAQESQAAMKHHDKIINPQSGGSETVNTSLLNSGDSFLSLNATNSSRSMDSPPPYLPSIYASSVLKTGGGFSHPITSSSNSLPVIPTDEVVSPDAVHPTATSDALSSSRSLDQIFRTLCKAFEELESAWPAESLHIQSLAAILRHLQHGKYSTLFSNQLMALSKMQNLQSDDTVMPSIMRAGEDVPPQDSKESILPKKLISFETLTIDSETSMNFPRDCLNSFTLSTPSLSVNITSVPQTFRQKLLSIQESFPAGDKRIHILEEIISHWPQIVELFPLFSSIPSSSNPLTNTSPAEISSEIYQASDRRRTWLNLLNCMEQSLTSIPREDDKMDSRLYWLRQFYQAMLATDFTSPDNDQSLISSNVASEGAREWIQDEHASQWRTNMELILRAGDTEALQSIQSHLMLKQDVLTRSFWHLNKALRAKNNIEDCSDEKVDSIVEGGILSSIPLASSLSAFSPIVPPLPLRKPSDKILPLTWFRLYRPSLLPSSLTLSTETKMDVEIGSNQLTDASLEMRVKELATLGHVYAGYSGKLLNIPSTLAAWQAYSSPHTSALSLVPSNRASMMIIPLMNLKALNQWENLRQSSKIEVDGLWSDKMEIPMKYLIYHRVHPYETTESICRRYGASSLITFDEFPTVLELMNPMAKQCFGSRERIFENESRKPELRAEEEVWPPLVVGCLISADMARRWISILSATSDENLSMGGFSKDRIPHASVCGLLTASELNIPFPSLLLSLCQLVHVPVEVGAFYSFPLQFGHSEFTIPIEEFTSSHIPHLLYASREHQLLLRHAVLIPDGESRGNIQSIYGVHDYHHVREINENRNNLSASATTMFPQNSVVEVILDNPDYIFSVMPKQLGGRVKNGIEENGTSLMAIPIPHPMTLKSFCQEYQVSLGNIQIPNAELLPISPSSLSLSHADEEEGEKTVFEGRESDIWIRLYHLSEFEVLQQLVKDTLSEEEMSQCKLYVLIPPLTPSNPSAVEILRPLPSIVSEQMDETALGWMISGVGFFASISCPHRNISMEHFLSSQILFRERVLPQWNRMLDPTITPCVVTKAQVGSPKSTSKLDAHGVFMEDQHRAISSHCSVSLIEKDQGQKISLPRFTKDLSANDNENKANIFAESNNSQVQSYMVQPHDSLFSIAMAHGISAMSLLEKNNMLFSSHEMILDTDKVRNASIVDSSISSAKNELPVTGEHSFNSHGNHGSQEEISSHSIYFSPINNSSTPYLQLPSNTAEQNYTNTWHTNLTASFFQTTSAISWSELVQAIIPAISSLSDVVVSSELDRSDRPGSLNAFSASSSCGLRTNSFFPNPLEGCSQIIPPFTNIGIIKSASLREIISPQPSTPGNSLESDKKSPFMLNSSHPISIQFSSCQSPLGVKSSLKKEASGTVNVLEQQDDAMRMDGYAQRNDINGSSSAQKEPGSPFLSLSNPLSLPLKRGSVPSAVPNSLPREEILAASRGNLLEIVSLEQQRQILTEMTAAKSEKTGLSELVPTANSTKSSSQDLILKYSSPMLNPASFLRSFNTSSNSPLSFNSHSEGRLEGLIAPTGSAIPSSFPQGEVLSFPSSQVSSAPYEKQQEKGLMIPSQGSDVMTMNSLTTHPRSQLMASHTSQNNILTDLKSLRREYRRFQIEVVELFSQLQRSFSSIISQPSKMTMPNESPTYSNGIVTNLTDHNTMPLLSPMKNAGGDYRPIEAIIQEEVQHATDALATEVEKTLLTHQVMAHIRQAWDMQSFPLTSHTFMAFPERSSPIPAFDSSSVVCNSHSMAEGHSTDKFIPSTNSHYPETFAPNIQPSTPFLMPKWSRIPSVRWAQEEVETRILEEVRRVTSEIVSAKQKARWERNRRRRDQIGLLLSSKEPSERWSRGLQPRSLEAIHRSFLPYHPYTNVSLNSLRLASVLLPYCRQGNPSMPLPTASILSFNSQKGSTGNALSLPNISAAGYKGDMSKHSYSLSKCSEKRKGGYVVRADKSLAPMLLSPSKMTNSMGYVQYRRENGSISDFFAPSQHTPPPTKLLNALSREGFGASQEAKKTLNEIEEAVFTSVAPLIALAKSLQSNAPFDEKTQGIINQLHQQEAKDRFQRVRHLMRRARVNILTQRLLQQIRVTEFPMARLYLQQWWGNWLRQWKKTWHIQRARKGDSFAALLRVFDISPSIPILPRPLQVPFYSGYPHEPSQWQPVVEHESSRMHRLSESETGAGALTVRGLVPNTAKKAQWSAHAGKWSTSAHLNRERRYHIPQLNKDPRIFR